MAPDIILKKFVDSRISLVSIPGDNMSNIENVQMVEAAADPEMHNIQSDDIYFDDINDNTIPQGQRETSSSNGSFSIFSSDIWKKIFEDNFEANTVKVEPQTRRCEQKCVS